MTGILYKNHRIYEYLRLRPLVRSGGQGGFHNVTH
jgi:hypothetical protein